MSADSRRTIYLDANADAAPNPKALSAYLAEARTRRGLPNAQAQAKRYLKAIAAGLGGPEGHVVATRGGTRADASVVESVCSESPSPAHIITSTIEHAAVSETLRMLEADGRCEVSRVAVGRSGRIEPEAIEAALKPHTRLISVIAASNETGVLQPVRAIARLAHRHGVRFHTDAVQCVGRCDFELEGWGVDFASFSAHKLGAVTGLGLVWTRDPADARALEHAPIVSTADLDLPGLAAVVAALGEPGPDLTALRDRLEGVLLAIDGAEVIGASAPRLSNTTLIRFAGCEGDGLMMALDVDGIAVSTGSACASGSIDPSPILLGMGLTRREATETIRLSLSSEASRADIDHAATVLVATVARMRAL